MKGEVMRPGRLFYLLDDEDLLKMRDRLQQVLKEPTLKPEYFDEYSSWLVLVNSFISKYECDKQG
jgi:hypothetical protein